MVFPGWTTIARERQQSTKACAARLTRRAFLRRYGVGGSLAALVGGLVGPVLYASGNAGRVYRGVSVAGIALGGLTRPEAERLLAERFAAYHARPFRVALPEASRAWTVAPADLALRADLTAAVTAALAVGRGAGPLDELGGWLGALLGGRDLPLPVALDEERLRATLEGWADGATTSPVDAHFAATPDGALTIMPDRPGQGFDLHASRAAFLAHAARLADGPVVLGLIGVPAALTAARLQTVAGEAATLTSRPLALALDTRRWALPPQQLRAAFGYRLDGERLVVALDPAALHPFLAEVAAEVTTPPRDARIELDGTGRYRIIPEQAGAALDEAATVAGLASALVAGRAEAAMILAPEAPAVTAADLAPAYGRLDRILNTPLVIEFAEYRRTLGRAELAPLVAFTPRPTDTEKLIIVLEPLGLQQLAEAIARDLNQEPRDAAFAWRDGAVRETEASREGRAVQVAPTARALEAAILGATGTVAPVVAVTAPRVASSDRDRMAIADRLGAGRTDYAFSIPSRKHNVELSVARLDGALIPPDAVFSFNQQVGAQTVANGYREAYGIALVGGEGAGQGEVRTVSSVAGGICQVSTTLFQAVYHAGLPLEERNWHLYWIESYGPPSSTTGLQGLDATVDDQAGLDFRFRNTTGGWLAIEAVADGARVRIALYGRDPGWRVDIDPPVLSNPRPADPAPQYERTHDLPPGQELVVEHATDGFDAANRVRVYDESGTLLRDKTFTSNYHPSRNVIQVGVPTNEPLESAR